MFAISDMSLTLLLIFGCIGGIVILAVSLHFLFERLLLGLARIYRSPRASSNTSASPASTKLAASNQLPPDPQYVQGIQNFQIAVERGEEVRMGWYETIFKLAHPVAGETEIGMIEGTVQFTRDNRCAVFSDCSRLVILDRVLDHGILMSLSRELGWFDTEINEAQVKLVHHSRHGCCEIAQTLTIDTEQADGVLRIPADWPGQGKMLPE